MTTAEPHGQPLRGIRVVDLTTIVFGPYASQLLGDYGADIIKIESPQGDSTRRTGASAEAGMASSFISVNRNKRSVVLDIKNNEHREALLTLIDSADVFMHNVRPQKIKALGLDADALMQRNPKLVYAALHGFGEDGPYSGRPAYDDTIQGLSGIAALGAMRDGVPSFVASIVADKTCGIYAAMAISMALVGRGLSGKGSYVEIPMFESMASFTLVEHMAGHHFSPPVGDMGYARLLTEWRKPYRTRDGHICVVPYTDAHWQAFFKGCGLSALASDERFIGISARTRNIDALYKILSDTIESDTTQYWLDKFEQLDIPASKVNSLTDLREDPHLLKTDFFRKIDDPHLSSVNFPDAPVRFDHARAPIKMPPRLGEHTTEVLAQHGIQLSQQ